MDQIIINKLEFRDANVLGNQSLNNVKRENIIPEYSGFRKVFDVRKSIQTARDDNIKTRVEKIAFLIYTDFIFFDGFEFFIVEFFEGLVENPTEVLDFDEQSIIIRGNVRIPVSDKTWAHITHFVSKERKLMNTFESGFEFEKSGVYEKALRGIKDSFSALRASSMPAEFVVLLENFSYLPKRMNDSFLKKVRKQCSRDISQVKAIITSIKSGDDSHEKFESYYLFEPIFWEIAKNNFSEAKVKNIAQCINYIHYFYDLIVSLGNADDLIDDFEKAIIESILALVGYRNFYKMVKKHQNELEFARFLPSPWRKIKQELLLNAKFRYNDFLTKSDVAKLLSDETNDQLFFFFTFLIFTGVRPSTPLIMENYKFWYDEDDLVVTIYMSKTNQYTLRCLDKLIPSDYLKRFVSLIDKDKYKSFIPSLNLDVIRRFFKKTMNRTDIYVCRRTFINQLALSFKALKYKLEGEETDELYGHETLITEEGARSLITCEVDEQIKFRLDRITLEISEIMRYSPNSTVILNTYLCQSFIMYLNNRKFYRRLVWQD